ncbi:hypothetical protein BDP55DRAFT_645018 [Colletotrichum godetiae]|uniref:Uncharacterized protein n=1 Tax=Colletotrichum godetiae TaxID=1209918 RepID=A0AAJ0AZI1_9PEZI|nr:uncharacterized protein BDP55DRAFT_645018 [Colletotrichum godetiae]KAK1699829.1 hypothetical protein BDP55DRAFT_645018 [Colletotrichum godetiae]
MWAGTGVFDVGRDFGLYVVVLSLSVARRLRISLFWGSLIFGSVCPQWWHLDQYPKSRLHSRCLRNEDSCLLQLLRVWFVVRIFGLLAEASIRPSGLQTSYSLHQQLHTTTAKLHRHSAYRSGEQQGV